MPIWVGILIGVLCLVAGAAVTFLIPFVRKNFAKNNAKKIIRDAEIKAEHITKNAQLDGKQAVNELNKKPTKKSTKENKNYNNKKDHFNKENKASIVVMPLY